MNRRDILQKLVGLPLVGVAVAGSLRMAEAQQSKAPQSSVNYQNKPHGNAKCSGCRFFIPGSGGGKGSCQIVAGAISPNGWCTAYAAKS